MYVADIFRAKMLVHDDAVNSFSLFLEQIIELYYSFVIRVYAIGHGYGYGYGLGFFVTVWNLRFKVYAQQKEGTVYGFGYSFEDKIKKIRATNLFILFFMIIFLVCYQRKQTVIVMNFRDGLRFAYIDGYGFGTVIKFWRSRFEKNLQGKP